MNRRAFTLVEMLVALILFGVLSMSLQRLMVSTQRAYVRQSQRLALNASIRAGISILPGEVRELNAGDAAGSDIIKMTDSSLIYKAMRGLYVLCDDAPASGRLTVYRGLELGLRPVDKDLDSILVFADFDPKTRADDVWLHGDVTNVSRGGTNCPDGSPAIRIRTSGMAAAALAGVTRGAPVRTFEVVEVSLYQDAEGYWLGGQRYNKSASVWTGMEPLLGPLAGGGLRLTYYDAAGAATGDPTRVVRIGITVTGQTRGQVGRTGGRVTYGLDSLVTQVALRNNPRF